MTNTKRVPQAMSDLFYRTVKLGAFMCDLAVFVPNSKKVKP